MLNRLAAVVVLGYLVILLEGCSVGMAMSGKEEPNLGAFRVGSPRGEVELQLGSPSASVTNPSGGRTDIYEYELGNKPSAGRAAGHAVLDVLTLGLWEIVGTPIEAFQGEKRRLSITYDANDRVVAINQAVAPSEPTADSAGRPQPTPGERMGQAQSTADEQRHALVERNKKNLLRLRVGMAREELQDVMGDPEGSEGYPWGSVWLYRTATTSGMSGLLEGDVTPVVLDDKGRLLGWGRNFLTEYQRTR